ncbi:hypothetical protein ACFPIJ_41775 [Dactylosporangium cerinum]|uniref:Uncharacterized protein n=1 Tax=Dactylosporangium cerinum TaxID=1434730 RepID=A0ABV9W8U1_9ACTN
MPGAGDSAPSAASAPATVTGLTDGLLAVPGAAKGDSAQVKTALGALKVVPRTGPARNTGTARKADAARGTGRSRDIDKVRGSGQAHDTGEAAGRAPNGTPGGRLGLPRGAADAPTAAAAGDRTGERRDRTSTLMLLGLGLIAAGLTAVGVTLTRRRPITG